MSDLTPEHRTELRTTADNANYVVILKRNELFALLDAADERDRLVSVIESVRHLHYLDEFGYCHECEKFFRYPCSTIRALDGTDQEDKD